MKGWTLLLSLLLLLPLSACRGEVEPHNAMVLWEQEANLTAQETPEELYAAALEEGTLIIYSTSTRMMDTAKSFEVQYPGLTVQVEDIREGTLYDMLLESYESGQFTVDVVCSSDGRGVMVGELLPQGVVYKYAPQDIGENMLPGANDALLMLVSEASILGYNNSYYEQVPVSNWWELTEEQWRGKVYMPNPAKSVTPFVFMSMITKNSEEMAEAYQARYGTDIELGESKNAGEAFIRGLVENDMVLVNSSDEVAEVVGAPGSNSPNIGIMVSSKFRLLDIGYELAVVTDLVPFSGISVPNNIMIAGGTKNINSAKLFVRWVLGEADGQGEGYKPYLHSGAWSLRRDVEDESKIPREALDLWEMDRTYVYENIAYIESLWESLVEDRP